jgi:transcriptional regulator with XRE-family HTH domain
MDAMSIGQRVRQARQARDLTIEQQAQRAGLTLSTFSDMERDDTRHPRASTLVALARALDMPPFWLVDADAGAPDRVTLGQRLRAARLARGLTQAQLATIVTVNVSYLGRLESGRSRTPSFVLLGALAAALDVSPTWLVGLAPDPTGES